MKAKQNTIIEDLYEAIKCLKNTNEASKFFRDLLTVKEIEEFANRWQVVKMIDKKMSYRQIQKETGVSTATITRINFWLNKGMGGYRLVLNKISDKNSNNKPRSVGLHR
ncbi:MAG: YerC/YecD family TrpR-related protein [bacterium]